MLHVLQSNTLLVVGGSVALLLIAVHALTADPLFRRDLRGAIRLLLAFILLRSADLLLQGRLDARAERFLSVAWMFALAFGLIRGSVSLTLWAVRSRERPAPKILRDVLDTTLYAIAALAIVKDAFYLDLSSLLAGSAIASVVLGLALQETLGNLFAGLSLQLERPFEVGDIVAVGEESGRVIQIGWRATKLENRRREVIAMPNTSFSKLAVKNFSRGLEPVGVDLFFGASYETPPNRVKQVVRDTLAEIPNILPEPWAKCRTWSYDESSIRYRIRFYLSDYSHSNAVKDEVLSRLWYRLRREGIEIPTPQRTVHVRWPEEKQEFPLEERVRSLESVDLFGVLGPEERARVAKEMAVHRFGRGERIIEEGALGQTFYLVCSGQVAVLTSNGVEVVRLSAGQYFGEMSLLTGEPRSATVVAVEDAVLFELDRPAFAQLFTEQPQLAGQLSAILAERRVQLRAVADAHGPTVDTREANRILSRLRQIFGLKSA